MVKTALAAICIFTLATTLYLSASLMVFRPPRAHHQQWALIAAVILVQGALTLFAVRAGGAKGLRAAAAAGGVVIAALGASSVYSTVSGPHFEGYSLVLGFMLVIQGLLTLIMFAGSSAGTAAPLRR